VIPLSDRMVAILLTVVAGLVPRIAVIPDSPQG